MHTLYKRPLILAPQPEGGYTITCPVLPELIPEADTLEDAHRDVADALTAIVEAYFDLGRPLPAILRPVDGESTRRVEMLWDEFGRA
jgi:antitoxin HicB